uniref:Imidazolonepropionase n=1 Tax=Solibacter usitatus (strain Ellin6076) TaxID=234267 RepID=HUTI_SOLUE|nr:RecName: Full=Imidazolonepropionase; AltName: Full=Imidazolone-5-propionate hydrolase [Candidatus Solibacter usitatus Ellin6076]
MSDSALLNCRQLVTLAGPPGPRTGPAMRELAIIPDGAMRIRDGCIAAVGPRADIVRSLAGDTEVIDAGWRVVLPGFIDAHTHPVFAGTRAAEYEQRAEGATYAEIAAAGGGIRSTVRRTREAGDLELATAARRYTDWFLRGGTTTIEAKSGYGLSLDDELRILKTIRLLNAERRLRYVPTFLGAHEIPDEYRGEIEDYVDLVIQEMLPAVAEDNLAEYCDVFCEPNVFPLDPARAILQAAQSLGLRLRIHADQFTGDYAALLAAELGAATADHLESTTALGLAALHEAGVQPVLLPASVYNLGSARYPAARDMIARGMAVVLATDFNPGSSPTASIPMVLSLASTQMKMTPAESITAVTVNAAHSLGRGSRIGSLEPGKAADFAIHECDDYRELAYFFGREPANAVYLAGQCVYRRSA